MSTLLVGYARCSTDQQDLTVQRNALLDLGVEAERIYLDHGLTGTNRDLPGLREGLAACRAGDTLVVTKLDRLAPSLPDARAIVDELTAAPPRSPTCSASAGPRCTAPSNANASQLKPAVPWPRQGAEVLMAPAVPQPTPLRDAGARRLHPSDPCPVEIPARNVYRDTAWRES